MILASKIKVGNINHLH